MVCLLHRNDAISPQVADVIEKVMSEDKSLLNQQDDQSKYTNSTTPTPSLNESNSMSPRSTSQPYTLNSESYTSGQAVPNKEGLYFCHLCSFSGRTAQDFDNHMTCHFEHVCPHCDYKSRTEGRLKRHIKDFHTDDPPDLKQRNMPGRPKVYRCKQCEYVATNKNEFWQHSRSHIKEEKLLQCPKCAFVTEYKHHLEYHLRNHFGSKPFKCNKCNYACVNKSMLNSHMKSHTNVYQYRCADCTYATKYCHSLKLHLHKYNHKPATVLNMDGSLPQGVDAEASGLSLLAKRGPPRGPRGPRKDKLDPFVGHLLGYPHTSLPMMSPGNMNSGMMSPYWPLLNQIPNGMSHRSPMPPLLPVSMNSSHMNSRHPTPDKIAAFNNSMKSNSSGTYRCNFCSLAAETKEMLNHHIMKVHAAENQDLFTMFGFSSDSLLEEQTRRQMSQGHAISNLNFNLSESFNQDHSSPVKMSQEPSPDLCIKTESEQTEGLKSSPHSWPRDSPDESHQKELRKASSHSMPELYPQANGKMSPTRCEESSIDILKQMTLKFGSGLPVTTVNGESPLDLTKRKSFSSTMFNLSHAQPQRIKEEPESQSAEENSISVDIPPSSPPRKRSRKGKAYKLDTLCLKLQEERGSSYNSDIEDETEINDNFENGYRGSGEGYTDSLSNEGSIAMEASPNVPSPDGMEPMQSEEMDLQMKWKALNEEVKNDDVELPKSEYDKIHSSLDLLNNGKMKSDNSDEKPDDFSMQNGKQSDPGNETTNDNSHTVEEHAGLLGLSSSNKRKNIPAALRRGTELAWRILQNENSGMNGTSLLSAEAMPPHSDQLRQTQDSPLFTSTPKTKLPQPMNCYECQYCDISFRDCVMYTMHMGYHGYKNPYKCNMCGQNSRDKVEFFLHIARAAHN
ncbi:hypothetical protein ScPMuIL_007716 [Solemya velum]